MKIEELKANVQKIIDKHVVDKRHNEPQERSSFRASGITDCPRALIFNMMNLPEDKYPRAKTDSAKGYKLMDHGSAIHTLIQNYFIEIGILDPNDLERKKSLWDPETLFSGHCDGIITLEGERILLEIKTINDRGFESISQPKEAHFYQGQAYVHFLNKLYGEKLDKILFLYVNRNSDDLAMKEFWIKADTNISGIIVNKLKILKQFLDKKEIYPIPEGFTPDKKTFNPCCWCPFKTEQLCLSKRTKMSDYPETNIVTR